MRMTLCARENVQLAAVEAGKASVGLVAKYVNLHTAYKHSAGRRGVGEIAIRSSANVKAFMT